MTVRRFVALTCALASTFTIPVQARAATSDGAPRPSVEAIQSGIARAGGAIPPQTTGTIILSETIDGRIVVKNAREEIVIRIDKTYGRRIEVEVEAGEYDVRLERPRSILRGTWTVADGGRVEVTPERFSADAPQPVRAPGAAPSVAVEGRNRVEVTMGMWRTSDEVAAAPGLSAGEEVLDFRGGLQYTRFVREDLAATFSVTALGADTASMSPRGLFAGSRTIVAMPLGLRWYPAVGGPASRAIRPFLAGSVGPVVGSSEGAFLGPGGGFAGSRTAVTVGGLAGAGLDVLVGRRWSLGVTVGYNWMGDFPTVIGDRRNYSGFDAGVSFGFLWGKGYER